MGGLYPREVQRLKTPSVRVIIRAVKLTLQTQLLPDKEQSRGLSATLEAFNAAAEVIAREVSVAAVAA